METKKPYHLMTPAERLADRITKNKQIEANVTPVLNLRSAGKQVRNAVAITAGLRRLQKEMGNDPVIGQFAVDSQKFTKEAIKDFNTAAYKALRGKK
jgi:hypothetical protein